jgi:hypothetical protein
MNIRTLNGAVLALHMGGMKAAMVTEFSGGS